jgi:16S rRNA (adenine1518-N6/adenine1519-N6)-dimethyltransferase
MSDLPRANKKLGQHFLRDKSVINKICTDFTGEYDAIVEVGPGPGILTETLSKIDKPLFLIEKDKRFEEHLQTLVPEGQLYLTDALKFDWSEFLTKHDLVGKKLWLVSNLPYNVGTVLFTQFLTIKPIEYMTLMFQKEVGQKTYLRQIKNQMNGLLFLSLNYLKPKALAKVSPGSFAPPPKVDSIVVSYRRRENPDHDNYAALNKYTRSLFAGKRKQIKSVLKTDYSKEQLAYAFKEAGVSENLRAEAMTYEQVLTLFKSIQAYTDNN